MSAKGNGIRNVVEQIALEIMTVDLDDLSRLGTIYRGLEEIAGKLPEHRPVALGLVESLSKAVEKVILDECGDVEDPLDVLARGIAMLQRLQVSFERNGQEVPDDPELLRELVSLSREETPAGLFEALEEDSGPASEVIEADSEERASPSEEAPEPTFLATGIDADIFFDFASEAEEHLSIAESTLLSLETNPEDSERLNAVFRAFHTIKGAAGFLNLQDIVHVAHTLEDVLDSARKGEIRLNTAILDVALESVDLLKELIETLKTQLGGETVQPRDVSGFLAKVAQISGKGGQPAEETTEGSGEAPDTAEGETKEENASMVGSGPADPAPPSRNQGRPEEGKRQEQQFVRVGTEKLDQLVNLVGELVIAQTQVSQNPEIVISNNQKLGKDISQLVKISNDIQEIAMSMRMVPIKATFDRMARMVRDLSRKCGKQVAFQVAGEETELDKNVVEEIVDPLTHMVRNAVDHGIEPAEERRAVGKPEKGTVTLEAYHKGGNIVIELRDDGKGLDRDTITKKAVERGLVQPDEKLADEEILNFIFHPGFSTAEQVSEVSGRGVGMDVVRRNIEKLRGKVEVQSEKGKGSTFTIRLPLTLAIIDGMVIGVGEERYILPLTSIVSSLSPREDEVSTVLVKGEMVKFQDHLFPLVRLYERFGVPPRHEDVCKGLVVVVEAEGKRCGLVVDELAGMQQVVIKALQEDLRHAKCFSGCAILGDGRVGLILDVNGLADQAHGKTAWGDAYQAAS